MQKNPVFVRILLALLLCVPLFFTPFTVFGWHFGKTVIFQILIEILALFTFFHYSFRKSGKLSFNFNWLDVSVTLFVAALILTSLTGVNFEQSFWMNQSRALGVFTWIHLWLMYFLLRVWLRSKEDWTKAFQWCLGVGFIITFTAAFQTFLPIEWRGDLGRRFSGILGNPAFFGAYMIPLIGMSAFQALQTKTSRKWLFWALFVWFSCMLVKSGSRGAFAGLLAGVGVFFVGFLGEKVVSKQLWKNKKLMISVFVFVTLCAGGVIFAQKFPQMQRLFDFSFEQQTGKTRLMAWDIAWKAFLDRPVVGVGYGNYEVPFNKYFNPQFFQYGFQETVWDRPHSAPLEMLSSMGVFSIFYFALFAVAALMLIKKSPVGAEKDQNKSVVFVATIFAYVVSISVMFDTIAALFLMIILFSYISYSVSGFTKKEIDVRNYFGISKGVVGAALLFMIFLNVQLLRTSIALKTSLEHTNLFGFSETVKKVFSFENALQDENAILLAEQFTKMEKENILGKANSMYWKDSAIKITEVLEHYSLRYPDNLSYPMWAAEVYLILGQFENSEYYRKAVDALKKAEGIAPQKQEVKILLTRAYLLQKDFEKALVTSQSAVDLAPNIGHSYYFLALTQEGSGKRAEALVSFAKSLENGYFPTENERQLYIDILTEEKKYTELALQYVYLIQVSPLNPDWYVKLATVYALDGKKKEALEMVEKAVVLYPPLRQEAENFIKANNLR